ncbi:hypothetical protein ACQEV9_46060 [Streptomyces chartreusis]|uniref:hypothetical protein n=1 Tax=Streptomyces chartreusis TaxID=1969 RepID=UPI003D8D7B4C
MASIVFTVLAFNAPLGTAAGFMPVLIGYGNQDGAPSTFIVVAYVAAAWFSALRLGGIIAPTAAGLDPLRVYSSCAAIGSACLAVLMFATSLAILALFQRDSTHTATHFESRIAPMLALVGIGGSSIWPSCTCPTSSAGAARRQTSRWHSLCCWPWPGQASPPT